jgi:outer membrane protein TolC
MPYRPYSPRRKPSPPVVAGLFALAALALAGVSRADPQPGLSFKGALDAAVARAPVLAARRAAAEGAEAARVSAGRLPDPRLSVGVDNVPVTGEDAFSLTDDFMTMSKIGWMQDVPNTLKRKARVDVANALAERERALLTAQMQTVKRETALAWLKRYFAEKRLGLFAALETENRVLQDTVNARIAAGRALPVEATQARQEAVQLADRRDELTREREQAQAALKRWVLELADASLSGDPPPLVVDPAHLRHNLQRHVELAAYEPMARMAAAEASEAQAGKKGDWGWEVSYAKRGSAFSDMVSFQVSFELPLFASKRRDPEILAKRKEVDRIQSEREEVLRKHAEEIERELAEQAQLTRQLARLRTAALPLAEERVRLLMASYRAGRADLGMVLLARRERAETELKAVELEGALAALHARLAYLIVGNAS